MGLKKDRKDNLMKKRPLAKKRKLYFRFLKCLMRIKYKEPRFVFLGERPTAGSLILSNHEGTDAPLSLEIYYDAPLRMWGAYEMNSGLFTLYRYQTRVYYHEKKHWNLHLARLFCLIASPLTYLFYRGLDLISTYRDARLVKTLRESITALEEGDNIVIFPEISDNGYLSELEGFHAGFALLCEHCLKRGLDLPIYVSYFRKSDRTYLFDAPVLYSSLVQNGESKEEVADRLRLRCNELGKMTEEEQEAGRRHAIAG